MERGQGGSGFVDGFGTFPSSLKGDCDIQIFQANTFVDQKGLQAWRKPRRATMHMFICIGAGAGGGGGHTRSAGNAGSGGGGGSSGSIAKIIIPSIFIPDVLYCQVGDGGLGGAASSFGSNGLASYISFNKSKANSSPIGNLLISDNNGPSTGGGPGGAGAAGSGGAAGTVATQTCWHNFGFVSFAVGQAGTGGGAQTGAAGTNFTTFGTGNALQLTGGCGGGGTTSANFDGGSIAISGGLDWGMGRFFASTNSVRGGTGSGADIHGSGGIKSAHPFLNLGGGGGAAVNSGVGGNGGSGGYGCGGGGGGAGTTGGRGGNGGPGLIIMISW